MRKKYIYLLAAVFVVAILFLFGVQYSYYKRVISMNEEQTRRFAQQALAEVAQDIEMNEFIRVLNKDIQGDLSFHKRINSRKISKNLEKTIEKNIQDLSSHKSIDTSELKEDLIWTYFREGELLDRYILKHIYKGYSYDSIPQLIPTNYLCKKVKYALRNRGIKQNFLLNLYNNKGELVYTYLEPGMLRSSTDTLGGIKQALFYNEEVSVDKCSFITLKLDFETDNRDIFFFALPGLVYMLLVSILSIVFVVFLLRELTFQSMKANFVNNMTHELKTPVSSISLAIQSLRNKQEDGKQEERSALLDVLEQEGNRLQLLVEKVLQSSLLRNKNYNMRLKTVDLYDILLPIIDIYSLHTKKLNGELTFEAEASDTWVRIDPIHLKNVFFNLYDNAIKYRRQDTPIKISTTIENTGNNILVSIEDNGIGVPKEALKRIFKRYYRVPTGNRHDVKGFGLGLAYVNDVIKIFGGSIVAQKSESGGLRMLISLPLTEGEEE